MQVRVYPELIFQAEKHNKPASAFRVYCLAKSWERGGSGFIPYRDFKHYLKELGIPKATYSRWVSQALELGLFEKSGKCIRLVSWQAACRVAGCQRVDRAVFIDLDLFISKGWLSWCWAGFVSRFDGMVSRLTLEQLTGVPERTQREHERKASVRNTANYASYGKPGQDPDRAIRLIDEPGHYAKDGELRRRLPNSRTVPEGIESAKKGRKSKINKALAELFSSGAASAKPDIYRLYSDNPKQTKRLIKRDRKREAGKDRPGHIFEFVNRTITGKGVYCAIAL